MNILCTGNKSKSDFKSILLNVKSVIENNNSNFFLDSNKKISGMKFDYIELNELSINNIDLVISIGGDGSLLSAIQKMKSSQIPIVGIRNGNLGFLNQANLENYKSIIENIIKSSNIEFFENPLISAIVYDTLNKTKYELLGFNDIVINHGKLLKLINVELFINDRYLNSYVCDGIIFSTSLGSTAYSLSAGGPIVSPDIDSFVITPISSHSLSSRSIVVSNKNTINVRFTPKSNNYINIVSDGQNYKKITNKFKISINKSNINSKLVKIENIDGYYTRLRKKIGW